MEILRNQLLYKLCSPFFVQFRGCVDSLVSCIGVLEIGNLMNFLCSLLLYYCRRYYALAKCNRFLNEAICARIYLWG